MIWIVAITMAGAVLLALKISGKCPRMALEIGAVAVLVALAGYSWQGRPDMPGNRVGSLSGE